MLIKSSDREGKISYIGAAMFFSPSLRSCTAGLPIQLGNSLMRGVLVEAHSVLWDAVDAIVLHWQVADKCKTVLRQL